MTSLTVLRACIIFWYGHALFQSIDCMHQFKSCPAFQAQLTVIKRLDALTIATQQPHSAEVRPRSMGMGPQLVPLSDQPEEVKAALSTTRDFAYARLNGVASSCSWYTDRQRD